MQREPRKSAADGGLPSTQNTWQNYIITFTTGASVNGDLTVMLSALGASAIQADFDNVRLTKAAIIFTPPTLGMPKVLDGNLILTGANGTPNGSYTWLSTTNLNPINWTTNTTGTLDGNGAFLNAIPIKLSQPASFYRLRMP